jgi:hypothetical protein
MDDHIGKCVGLVQGIKRRGQLTVFTAILLDYSVLKNVATVQTSDGEVLTTAIGNVEEV